MKTTFKTFKWIIASFVIFGGLRLLVSTAYNMGMEESSEQLKETELFLQEACDEIDDNRNTIQALNNQLDGYTKVYNDYIVVESDTGNLYIFAKDLEKGTPEAYSVTDEKTKETSLRIVLE